MKTALRLLPVLATVFVQPALLVNATTFTLHPWAEHYSVEVTTDSFYATSSTPQEHGTSIAVYNAFPPDYGLGPPATTTRSATFKVLPDPGYELVVGSGWTGAHGGLWSGYNAGIETLATTSALYGGAETTVHSDYFYNRVWGDRFSIDVSASNFTPFSNGFLLNWAFTFCGDPASSSHFGNINFGVSTVPASTIPDQPATLLLLGLALLGLAQARKLGCC